MIGVAPIYGLPINTTDQSFDKTFKYVAVITSLRRSRGPGYRVNAFVKCSYIRHSRKEIRRAVTASDLSVPDLNFRFQSSIRNVIW